ncbi:hypothetical protein KQX54_006474 [Cotesia glomerata]|uniref:Uncharacterized protein n=1 Tax=Cotesia glomerata TaxID=32391 RepID=A0AAV7IBJ0_COTGL|nr:hypothetical protein KQX54_006474 [Cotesia glomerata]
MIEILHDHSDVEDSYPEAESSIESKPVSVLHCLRKFLEINNDRYVKRITRAIRYKDTELIDSLLLCRVKISTSTEKILMVTTLLLDKLIKHGGSSKFWANSSDLIHHVLLCKEEHEAMRIIFFLIKRYAKIHGPYANEIVNVVEMRNFEHILKLLVRNNININFIQYSNDLFFHTVVKNNSAADRTNFVQTLLDGGVDINATNSSNELAIEVCCDKYKKVLKKHIVNLIAAGCYVAKKNCEAVKDDDELINHRNECDTEVLKMKNAPTEDSNITLDKVLSLNIYTLAVGLTHADLDELLYFDINTYPIYRGLLYYRLSHISVRQMLLNSIDTFEKTLLFELPFTFIFKLYSYLTDQNLQLLAVF